MSERDEKYRVKYRETLQPRVDEPIEALGIFGRAGGMAGALLSTVSPLVLTVNRIIGRSKAGGLPQNVILALTATAVHVFPFKPKGFGIKATDAVARWDRTSVKVEVTGTDMLSRRVSFQLPDGELIELDSNRLPGFPDDFNKDLIDALS